MSLQPKVLITGVSGFLGSHLARCLSNAGFETHGLIRGTSDLCRIGDFSNRLQLHNNEQEPIDQLISSLTPISAVIHTATEYGPHTSEQQIYGSNVDWPLKVLTATINSRTRLFLNCDTFYPPQRDNYSSSKRQFLNSGRALTAGTETMFLNLRLHHMYGPADGEAKMIPTTIRQCLSNQPEIPLTKGEQIRSFVYIDDVISAFLTILTAPGSRLSSTTDYDIGSNDFHSIRELVDTIRDLTKSQSKLVYGALPYSPNEVMSPTCDLSPLLDLGWEPKVGISEGLAKTIGYFANR